MNYFYLNPNAANTIMQVFIIILLFVIGILMYMRSGSSDDIKKAIDGIEVSCPPCPTLKGKDGKCPACICPEAKSATPPKCPKVTCPTVNDIVGGIFPGRNKGITDNGEYFPINAYEDMEIVPAYSSVINQMPAFKDGLILGNKDKKKVAIDTKEKPKLTTSKDPSEVKTSSELELKGLGKEEEEEEKKEGEKK